MFGDTSTLEAMKAIGTARSGAILVCRDHNRFGDIAALQAQTASLGFAFGAVSVNGEASILYHGGESEGTGCLVVENGDYVVATGMFFFRGEAGINALQRFYDHLDPDRPEISETMGHFTLAVRKHGKCLLMTDALSTCKFYIDPQKQLISSSFLVVAALSGSGGIDAQGCYEYAWNGVAFGERTFLDGVRTLPVRQGLLLEREGGARDLRMPVLEAPQYETLPLEERVDRQLDGIRAIIELYVRRFGDRINLSMSGGYDSRLLLALLLEAGIRPKLFVYGQPANAEVQIVATMARGENLSLMTVDKGAVPPPAERAYAAVVAENSRLFDGWKVYGSIFDGGADALDRIRRVEDGHVKINGSGGEIYRNFFYLWDRPFSVREIVWSFYGRYAPSWCTERFRSLDYEDKVSDSILFAIGATDPILDRSQVELVYPLFRTRYWTARDVALNLRFGPALFPYMEPRAIAGTSTIPIAWKSHGSFEGRMIRRVHPRLAAYPSTYGRTFAADPGLWSRAKSLTTYARPPRLRKYSYRFQHMRGHSDGLRGWITHVVDPSFPHMSNFFHMSKIADDEVFERVATMEYICQNYVGGNCHYPALNVNAALK